MKVIDLIAFLEYYDREANVYFTPNVDELETCEPMSIGIVASEPDTREGVFLCEKYHGELPKTESVT